MTSETTKANEEADSHKMSRKEFWIRFSLWISFAVIAPIGFLAWRYGLFTSSEGAKTSLNGWGILAVIILGIFFIYMIKEAKKGMPEGSMLVQCLDGYGILIPLVLLILLLDGIKDSIAYFEEVLIVLVVCEGIAVPINPMRKWAAQNNIERGSNLLSSSIKKALRETLKDDDLKK
jgi:cation transport ATPase